MAQNERLNIGPYEFTSRLLMGTGKYSSLDVQGAAIDASETEILTFAIRRLPLDNPDAANFLERLDLKKYKLLPNTAGCYTVDEAVRVARLAKASGLCDMIKVEVIGDPKTLLPDPIGTLEATKILVDEGFIVLTYTNDDPILAKKLQEAGAAAVMPGASPIGSGQGITNPNNIRLILEDATVPIIIDAGLGSPTDAALAMELGADAVLLNTAVAAAKHPVLMAEAFKLAVEAGRKGFLAGRIPKKKYATASSPLEGIIE